MIFWDQHQTSTSRGRKDIVVETLQLHEIEGPSRQEIKRILAGESANPPVFKTRDESGAVVTFPLEVEKIECPEAGLVRVQGIARFGAEMRPTTVSFDPDNQPGGSAAVVLATS